FQAEDGIRDFHVTGVQTCALPIWLDRVTQDYSLMHAPPALDNIVVYDYEGNEIKTIFLNYGYFREDKLGQPDQANFLRLRLDSIEEWFRKSDGTYEKKPPYSFQYNQIQLPAKNSLAIDYWGYYNGANNEDIKDYKFYDLDVPGYVINQEITNTGSKIGRASCREREDISEENISI